MAFNDALAFANHDPLICFDASHGFHLALGPAYGQIRLGGVPQAEMHAEISLRDMKSPAANFVDLLAPASGQRQSSADRVTARGGNRADQQRVAPWSEVLQQRRRLEKIDDHNLLGPIIVE